MINACFARLRHERGAVLVHVTVAIIGLLAFSALVVDYGVMWSARRQAQNSADAAALGGAISMAYKAPGSYDTARAVAQKVGAENRVFGVSPNIDLGSGDSADVTQDISFPTCPPGSPAEGEDACVRVNVYRNATKDALPTFFARLFGMLSQGVRASATAEIIAGNSSDCIKPWAVSDRWDDTTPNPGPPVTAGGIQNPAWDPDWNTDSTWDPAAGDLYVPPSSTNPGTGFRIYDANGQLCCDYGLVLPLKQGTANAFWYQEIDFHEGNSSAIYRAAIAGCHTGTIGETVSVKPGTSHGPTDQGVDDLIAQDPQAVWYNPNPDPSKPWLDTYNPNGVSIPSTVADMCPTGCVYSPTTGINSSPRIGAITVMSPAELLTCSNCDITVRNILGFFIDRPASGNGNNQVVWGRLVKIPGKYKTTGTTVEDTGSFLKTIILVR